MVTRGSSALTRWSSSGEVHAVRALEEELVFVAFLHKVEASAAGKGEEADAYLTWHI